MQMTHSPDGSEDSEEETKDETPGGSSIFSSDYLAPNTEQWYIDFVNPVLSRLED